MKIRSIFATAALAVVLVPAASAEIFGGAELALTRDDNFLGASAGQSKTKENITSLSGYVAGYWPSANARSAWIFKGDVLTNRMDKHGTLDNNVFGLSLGRYHAFSPSNSMTATLGANAKRFDDSQRNGEFYGVQLGFKQKTSDRFSFREGILLEHGTSTGVSAAYDGYGFSASLNPLITSSTLLTLGAAWNRRVYNVTAGNQLTGKQLSLGLVQELGKTFYLRAGLARQSNTSNGGIDYRSNIVNVGVGIAM